MMRNNGTLSRITRGSPLLFMENAASSHVDIMTKSKAINENRDKFFAEKINKNHGITVTCIGRKPNQILIKFLVQKQNCSITIVVPL